MPDGELERQGSPERVADEVGAFQRQRMKESPEQIRVLRQPERPRRVRRTSATRSVPGHDRVLVSEFELVPPDPVVPEEAVQEDDRRPLAFESIGDPHPIKLAVPDPFIARCHGRKTTLRWVATSSDHQRGLYR